MKRKVLFLCTGNSCRSQMAEAIVNARLGDAWEAYSAGTQPAGYVHPLAIRALAGSGPGLAQQNPGVGALSSAGDVARAEKGATRDMDQSAKNPHVPQCTCMTEGFADLPPELRPQRTSRKSGLRKVACPGCGLVYWTNRPTDLCIDCEKKGRTGGPSEHRD